MITKVTTFNLFLPSRVYFFDSSTPSRRCRGTHSRPWAASLVERIYSIAQRALTPSGANAALQPSAADGMRRNLVAEPVGGSGGMKRAARNL